MNIEVESDRMIHQTAIIDKGVQIGKNVKIGAYSIIEDGVDIFENCIIKEHAIIRSGTILEKGVEVDSFAVIGGNPQDVLFDEKRVSGVHIGEYTKIREGVTINRATVEGQVTRVGRNCFLMANCHVAHDCVLGNEVKMANGVLLGGHVHLDDFIFMGGNAVVHQNLRIGEGVIVAGCARLNLDIPPFLIVSEAMDVHGLNLIGIKRRGFGQEEINDLKHCYREILASPGNPYEKAKKMQEAGIAKTYLGKTFVTFFETRGKKGCVHERHIGRKNREDGRSES